MIFRRDSGIRRSHLGYYRKSKTSKHGITRIYYIRIILQTSQSQTACVSKFSSQFNSCTNNYIGYRLNRRRSFHSFKQRLSSYTNLLLSDKSCCQPTARRWTDTVAYMSSRLEDLIWHMSWTDRGSGRCLRKQKNLNHHKSLFEKLNTRGLDQPQGTPKDCELAIYNEVSEVRPSATRRRFSLQTSSPVTPATNRHLGGAPHVRLIC